MRERTRSRHRLLLAAVLAGPGAAAAQAPEPAAQGFSHQHSLSLGGHYRLHDQDARQIGRANGGTGTSLNNDDGNRNFGQGWVNFGAMGRSRLGYAQGGLQAQLQLNYFHDFLLHDGRTDGARLSPEAIDRVGQGAYLGEAWLGWQQDGALPLRLRLGNQVLRWGESPSLENQINFINPVLLSRSRLPGATAQDSYRAVPMLWGQLGAEQGWRLEGFWQTSFKPSEAHPRGSFFSGNDYYSPGGNALFLSADVPDGDASVTTPATPLGSRVARRNLGYGHPTQFGLALRTPALGGGWKAEFGLYAAKYASRELSLSNQLGRASDLMGQTSANFAAGGRYLVAYPHDNRLLGVSAKFWPTASTQVRIDASRRFRAALQLDDQAAIEAGMAPGAVVAACANPASAGCQGTLARFNRNPVVRHRGGITAASAASWFGTVIAGAERYNLSHLTIGVGQGLPNLLGSRRWTANAEWNLQYVHGYNPAVLPIDSPAPTNGTVANGIASKVTAAYKIGTRLDYGPVGWFDSLAVFGQFQHEYRGNSPFPRSLYTEARKWLVLGVAGTLPDAWAWQLVWQGQINHGDEGDMEGDRAFVGLALTKKF